MSEHKDNSNRKKNMKGKIGDVAGVSLLLIVVFGITIGLYFFGIAGIFKLLGIEYHSVWSLIIFVASFFILALFAELFFKPVSYLITKNMSRTFDAFIVKFSILGLVNGFCLFAVDMLMASITITLKAGIIIAIIITLIELAIEDRIEEAS